MDCARLLAAVIGVDLFLLSPHNNPQLEFNSSLSLSKRIEKSIISNVDFAESFTWEAKSGFLAHTPQKTASNLSFRSYFLSIFFSYPAPHLHWECPVRFDFFLPPETIQMLTRTKDHVVRKTLLVRNGQLCNCTDFFLSDMITMMDRVITSCE